MPPEGSKAVFDAPRGLRPRGASKTALGIYPVPPQKPDVNLYICIPHLSLMLELHPTHILVTYRLLNNRDIICVKFYSLWNCCLSRICVGCITDK